MTPKSGVASSQTQALNGTVPIAPTNRPAPLVLPAAKETKIKEITLKIPASWTQELPANKLRLAQFKTPTAIGDKHPTELVISSSPASGGDVDLNLKRWVGQFSAGGRQVNVTTGECSQGKYHLCDVTGTYELSSAGGKKELRHGHRSLSVLLAAEKKGIYYLRLIGPEKSVSAVAEAFRASFGADASQEQEYKLP
ncbi:MAG: hypothetical protein H7062_17365 [Candidatus Saccharimonas sp.]|nr:hypothetical protein [Planctomycetaceae bacterium]